MPPIIILPPGRHQVKPSIRKLKKLAIKLTRGIRTRKRQASPKAKPAARDQLRTKKSEKQINAPSTGALIFIWNSWRDAWSSGLNLEHSAETPGGIIRFCPVMVNEYMLITPVGKERSSQFPDGSGCFYPTGCADVKFPQFLQ